MNSKVSCNTEVDESLLKQARLLDINLSATIESALNLAIKEKNKERWFKENAGAIAEHNARIQEFGTFSEIIGQLE